VHGEKAQAACVSREQPPTDGACGGCGPVQVILERLAELEKIDT
jgi:hypothetical protein